VAAVLFGLALLLELKTTSFGTVVTATTLTTAGLLCGAAPGRRRHRAAAGRRG
jgi:hypothetical protein